MKISSLLFLLSVSLSFNSFAQNAFGWSDKIYHEGDKRIIRTIHWDLDKAGLERDTATILTLDTIIEFLTMHPLLKVEVGNHTDPQGSRIHNNRLSQARAQCIVDYIRHYSHIDSARLIAKGYGSTQPIYDTNYIKKLKTAMERQAAYQIDRRTEIKILSTCYGHERFDWDDKILYPGSKRILWKLFFHKDSDTLFEKGETVKSLDSVLGFIQSHQGIKLEIGVYANISFAPAKHDLELSYARASSILKYLTARGANVSGITTKGYITPDLLDYDVLYNVKSTDDFFHRYVEVEIKILNN